MTVNTAVKLALWLDDERPTPVPMPGYEWFRAYTAFEAIEILRNRPIHYLSLDHDLGDETVTGTGNDVVRWIEEQVGTTDYEPPLIICVHSANPPAHARMLAGVESIARLRRQRQDAQVTALLKEINAMVKTIVTYYGVDVNKRD